jgi:DNA alkylation repair enzyme
MPAIDPGRLEREVLQLETLFGSPAELTRATLDILGFYAERARRPSSVLNPEKRGRSLAVPPPVLRAIGTGLQKQTGVHPENGWPVANALWDAELRETRILACWVLSGIGDERVAEWVEHRATGLDDPPVMMAVVDRAFLKWRGLSGQSYVDQIGRWLASSRSVLHALGLRALDAGLELPALEDMHHAFEALASLPRPVRGEARAALSDLLETLARRSPAETTRFLMEEIDADQPGAGRLARSLLPSLPLPQRERLTAVLSSRGVDKASS